LEDIFSLRIRITEIDKQILLLLKERVKVSKKIGIFKRKKGVAIRDYQREDELYKHITKKAIELRLDALNIKNIYQGIIGMCTYVQESNNMKSTE